MLVPDPWTLSKSFGVKNRWTKLEDTPESRKLVKFFEVSGFKYTALPEGRIT